MRILYATDGSEAALAGAHFLAALPLTRECHLRLLAVLPERGASHAQAALGPARKILRDSGASIDTLIRWGHAGAEILHAAEAMVADLIVVGSGGRTGLAHLWLGSVSEHAVRHAPCPVLVARPLVAGLREAVLGVDGSECGARAAAWLEQFPLPRACTVTTVAAHPARSARHAAGETGHRPDGAKGGPGLAGGSRAQPAITMVEDEDPARALLRLAAEREADLIVVGSHGRSGIGRLLLGSVSEKVLRQAHCSVLVIREARRSAGVETGLGREALKLHPSPT